MKNNLVLGLGSSILADQSIVMKLIEQLKPNYKQDIDFSVALISSLDLVHVFENYKNLLMLDTIQVDRMPIGKMKYSVLDTDSIALHTENYHDSSIQETLQVAELLQMKVPKNIGMLTINVRDIYSISEDYSSELQQQLPRLVQELEEILLDFFKLEGKTHLFVD